MNTCTLCKEEKPWADFEPNSRMRNGYLNQCRKCKYHRRQNDEAQRTKKYEIHRRWKLKALYGITEDAYWTMHALQLGRCAICDKEPTNGKLLSVDHDHVTKQARMLLCNPCNLMIGNALENPEILVAGAKYLLKMQKRGFSTPRTGGE